MAEVQSTGEITLGKEQTLMLESLLLLAFCLFIGLVSLAICVWLVAARSAFYDGRVAFGSSKFGDRRVFRRQLCVVSPHRGSERIADLSSKQAEEGSRG